MEQYTGSQIVVLEGLEAVRKRPGMYIGSTGSRGLHHLVWEILDNGIDEHLGGFCNEIEVTLLKDGGISITDHGRGVPIDIHPTKHIPTARVVYTILHAGGKFGSGAYKVSGGLHGVGASVVNALSSRMIVEIRRDGRIYQDEYQNGGHPITELVDGMLPVIGKCNKSDTGTKVTFYPDPSIFETVEFKADTITKKLKETAFLNKGLRIRFSDEISGLKTEYFEEYGIKSFVSYINRETEVLHKEPIYIEGKSGDIEVEVAFQYTSSFTEQINAYCNRINVVDGGTLVTGFKMALTRVMNQYARELGVLKEKDENFDGKDIRNGLVAIISIKHPDPQFEGQTKTKLGNTDAKTAVDDVFSGEVPRYFDKNVDILKTILDNSMKSYTARKAGDKARNAVLKQLLDVDTKSKLASCSSKKPEECEVYIVEGDSAGGTVKTARNRRTQAVLPLRGKILNTWEVDTDKLFSSDTVHDIAVAIGVDPHPAEGDPDLKGLRYGKICILSDADVDGSHIQVLLLTLFYRHFPKLIELGHVYVSMPPLYRVDVPKKGRKPERKLYCLDDRELQRTLASLRKEGFDEEKLSISRFKGLGEMKAQQLAETTLHPDTRRLLPVALGGVTEQVTKEIMNLLMGQKGAGGRKLWMEEYGDRAETDV